MVAQIYGVGLITTRLTGVPFEVGIFVGLGGILVCSFLGGMRAVTWTQVAQYIILIVAYMIPVVWLSVKHTGVPMPQLVYGKVLEKVTAREQVLIKDPKELEVRGIFKARADAATAKLKGLPGSFDAGKQKLAGTVDKLKAEQRRPTRSRPPRRRWPRTRRTPPPPRRSGPRTRASPRARGRRCRHAEAVPRQGRGGARHLAHETSWRWCSA